MHYACSMILYDLFLKLCCNSRHVYSWKEFDLLEAYFQVRSISR